MARREFTPEQLRAHIDSLYHDIFQVDPRGQTLLADLHARFVKKPSPSDFTEAGMLKVFVQTHQREVIEYIVRCINRHNGVIDSPPPPTESNDEPA